MDTFMDKLAQRINAQEIIKANVAADSAETAPQPMQQGQNAEYNVVIQKLKETAEQYAQGASALTASTVKAEQTIAKTQELMEAGIGGIAENAVRTAESLNKLEAVVVRAENSLGKLETAALQPKAVETSAVNVVQDSGKIEENAARLEGSISKVEENATRTEQVLTRMENAAGRTEQTLGRVGENVVKMQDTLARMDENTAMTQQALSKMDENTAMTQQALGKMAENTVKTEESMSKVEMLLASSIAKIEEMQGQGGSQNTEELQALLSELKQAQNEQFEQLSDHVHKENVKVYRNVQAAMVEENGKQNDATAKSIASLSGKLSAVLGVSAVALLAAVAGVIFQILVYLHIL
ncbi:MAG: hypothetical protein J1E65_01195 [Lachnospiraceae bacterium]|nr:hypothetical protein [Lachnospiraceae bacterium]